MCARRFRSGKAQMAVWKKHVGDAATASKHKMEVTNQSEREAYRNSAQRPIIHGLDDP